VDCYIGILFLFIGWEKVKVYSKKKISFMKMKKKLKILVTLQINRKLLLK
jgi:hypothetical protein